MITTILCLWISLTENANTDQTSGCNTLKWTLDLETFRQNHLHELLKAAWWYNTSIIKGDFWNQFLLLAFTYTIYIDKHQMPYWNAGKTSLPVIYRQHSISQWDDTQEKKYTIQQGTSKCQDHGSRINWSVLYKTGFLNESLNIVWANTQVLDLTALMCSLIRVLVNRIMPFSTIPSPILKFDFLNMPIWYDLSYNELSTEVISSPNSYWERSERRKILLWNGD